MVRSLKDRKGKSGGDYYGSFRKVLKAVCQMGQDIDTVKYDLAKSIAKEGRPNKERLSLLRGAFLISQGPNLPGYSSIGVTAQIVIRRSTRFMPIAPGVSLSAIATRQIWRRRAWLGLQTSSLDTRSTCSNPLWVQGK